MALGEGYHQGLKAGRWAGTLHVYCHAVSPCWGSGAPVQLLRTLVHGELRLSSLLALLHEPSPSAASPPRFLGQGEARIRPRSGDTQRPAKAALEVGGFYLLCPPPQQLTGRAAMLPRKMLNLPIANGLLSHPGGGWPCCEEAETPSSLPMAQPQRCCCGGLDTCLQLIPAPTFAKRGQLRQVPAHPKLGAGTRSAKKKNLRAAKMSVKPAAWLPGGHMHVPPHI